MGDQTSSSGCYGALVGCEHRPNGPQLSFTALKPVTGFACFGFFLIVITAAKHKLN
jgi:hypothetical protein